MMVTSSARGGDQTHAPNHLYLGRRSQRRALWALLAAALQRRLAVGGQTPQLFGMGGERMQAAGVERVVRSKIWR